MKTTRKQAITSGDKYYFTGVACQAGHLSKRYTSNCKCVECSKTIYKAKELVCAKEKYANDEGFAEKIRKRARDHYKKIKRDPHLLEKIRNVAKIYAKEKRASDPEYLERQRAASRVATANWKKQNPEKHRASIKARKAAIRGTGRVASRQIVEMVTGQGHRCNGCTADISEGRYHLDHIMPIKLGGRNEIENLQALCPACNLTKSSKHPDQWIMERGGK